MLQFERPAPPPEFAWRRAHGKVPDGMPNRLAKALEEARAAVWSAMEVGEKPLFPDLWGDELAHKNVLAGAQKRKCAYCETKLTGIAAVEHYRPKSEISALGIDPSTWGEEVYDSLPNVRGRITQLISERGYCWLAYEWSNYLVACERCNHWKGTLFPVREPRPPLPSLQKDVETFQDEPLLLNPFEQPAPYRHFQFGDLGTIQARDGNVSGSETIKTCGLDRPSLDDARKEKALRAHELVLEVNEGNPDAILNALHSFHKMGQAEAAYAGMVRSIFEAGCNMTWEELEASLSDLDSL